MERYGCGSKPMGSHFGLLAFDKIWRTPTPTWSVFALLQLSHGQEEAINLQMTPEQQGKWQLFL